MAVNMFEHLLRLPTLPIGFADMIAQALNVVHARRESATTITPPPLIPGGAWLHVTARPHPDCLAWLIRTRASSPSTAPVYRRLAHRSTVRPYRWSPEPQWPALTEQTRLN